MSYYTAPPRYQAARSNTDMDLRAPAVRTSVPGTRPIEAIGHPDRIGIGCQDAVGPPPTAIAVRLARVWIDVFARYCRNIRHPDAASRLRPRMAGSNMIGFPTTDVGVDAIHCSV